jgi:hypothetical protein
MEGENEIFKSVNSAKIVPLLQIISQIALRDMAGGRMNTWPGRKLRWMFGTWDVFAYRLSFDWNENFLALWITNSWI